MKWTWIFLTAILASCSWGGKRDGLTDCPGEVLVVGDSADIVASMLSGLYPALPDSEPQFDVATKQKAELQSLDRYRPLIVRTDIGAQWQRTAVVYTNNMYAREQTVVTLRSPSYKKLQRDLAPKRLTSLLNSQIIEREAHKLRTEQKNHLARKIKRQFNIDIALPPIITLSKQGRDFAWLSSADGEYTLNFCFYRSADRDSVMQQNLKGRTDSQYMTTVEGSTLTRQRRIGHTDVRECRGLWQMEGDAMGGPYMQMTFRNPADGKTVVAEAFVYAPMRKKRDLMRLAEASLLTMFQSQQQDE